MRKKKDGHDAVAVEIGRGAGLEKNVAFVDEQHTAFHLATMSSTRLRLNSISLRGHAEAAAAHDEQRHAHGLGNGLGRQRLALAGNDIAKLVLVLDLALRKGQHQLLVAGRQHGAVKGVLVEAYLRRR